ncbi:thioredoxin domain-containing protein [Yanghanlia caeni]|uniref:Thioredoxin domain-containing protein n=2 Tax=Alcaligenaceae TaxID=506 RepID=A0ABU1D979_9BURK|nr:thioredoxin domain-containing protein [Alcaligenaceae bacterium LG-2]NYT24450.1 thioredoxin domain-containing protein [Alcaligenaceae bacterium]
MKKQTLLVLTSILAVMTFSVGAFLYEQSQLRKQVIAENTAKELTRMHSPVLGSANAKVTIVEFFDPSCETCRAFYSFVKKIVETHEGRVNLVIRYAPFHEGSEEAVRILEAARIQDKYWPLLDVVMDEQPQWASHHDPQPSLIWSYAEKIGVDVDKARKDANKDTVTWVIDQDKSDLRTLNVKQTPTFYVNGKPLPKFGYEDLKRLVDQEVKANYR